MASSSSRKRRECTPSPSEGEGSFGFAQSESHEVTERPAFPLRDPGTLPVYLSLRCLMARLLRPLMLGCFLVRRVSLVPLRFQTLEKFLIFRSGRDFERRCLSFLISFRGKSKVGPSRWIRNYLMRSSWVA